MLILPGLLVLAMLGTLRASSPTPRPVGIAPSVWEATAAGAEADVLIVLEEQADLDGVASLPTREERQRYVYDTLRTTALRSQGALRSELDEAGVQYRPFYIVNMVALRANRGLLTWLGGRPEVGHVVANPRVHQELPKPKPAALGSQAEEGIEWNVKRIHADDVWALGYTGEGVVVAGQDTGYDWTHPALIRQYRGYRGVTATHDYNWHDAIHTSASVCGADSPNPCDDNGHGTHTMGTIVGDDDAANRIGVAPGAQWIGCRNMEQGFGTPATYAECFEFFLAPYPVGGDPFAEGEPSLAPHVINNSWTCPPYEGCDPDTLQTVVENVRAAGILVVASAGNGGSGCGSVQDPPAIYDAAYSVGATDTSDVIATFSSRGPVTADDTERRKPDVTAPGVMVRSSVPNAGYGSSKGTSMAGPHVAGTAALLWSAAPSLIGDVNSTEQIIARTARHRTTTQGCGGDTAGDVPNNVYGWGIVDALTAVQGTLSRVELRKEVSVLSDLPVCSLAYELAVKNTSLLTLTDVALMDTVPASTTFAWASGTYTRVEDSVMWTVSSLAPWETLTAQLGVVVDCRSRGAYVINADYEVRAQELLTPMVGSPVETFIPWRILISPVLKGWLPQGGRGG